MVKVRVATFKYDLGSWRRNDIRQVNSSEVVETNLKRGCLALKRIPKNSLKFPSKPSWKPKKSNRC